MSKRIFSKKRFIADIGYNDLDEKWLSACDGQEIHGKVVKGTDGNCYLSHKDWEVEVDE